MAKDLPYFKFFCSEWNDGDITLETYEHQGLFINICSYYWSNECNVNFDKLLKRFRGYEELIDDLIVSELFKIKEDRFISISFLDEQKEERVIKSKINSINGSKGGRPKKRDKSENKPNALNSLSETKGNKKREDKKREDKKREEDIIKGLKPELTFIFNKWLVYRKEIKKEVKVLSTLQALVNNFNSNSLSCCEWVVNNSIENNYIGLLWDNYKSTATKSNSDEPTKNIIF